MHDTHKITLSIASCTMYLNQDQTGDMQVNVNLALKLFLQIPIIKLLNLDDWEGMDLFID